jgi:hypothetical protein
VCVTGWPGSDVLGAARWRCRPDVVDWLLVEGEVVGVAAAPVPVAGVALAALSTAR